MFAPLRCCFERDKFFLNLLRHVVHRVHGGLPDDYVKYLCRHDRVEIVVVRPTHRGCELHPCCCSLLTTA